MDPTEKEQTLEGDKRPVKNHPFRALNENFNEVAQSNTNTALGGVLGKPGEGTSAMEGPALGESPSLGKEMLKEQEMLEDGLVKEKEAERERIKRKGKTLVVSVINADTPQMEEAEEEIA